MNRRVFVTAMRFFLSIIVFIGLISGQCHATGPGPAPEHSGTDINADAGNPIQANGRHISMDVTDADIRDILARIGQQSGLCISADDQLSGKTSFTCTDMPVEEALKQLCRNTAFVYEYVPGSNSYRIISAGAYSGKPGNSTESPSVEPLPEREDKRFDKKGRLLYKPGELLVRYQKGISEKRISEFHKSVGSRVIGHCPRLRLQRIKLVTGLSEKDAVKLYSDSGLFENAEKHAIRYLNAIPNDPSYDQQWGLSKIKAPDAWDITTGSPEIVIAVIDSGTDYNHQDLSGNIWTNQAEENGLPEVDDDGNGYVDDRHGWDFAGDVSAVTGGDNDPIDRNGHGTRVSGIISAKGNNAIGISGICWNVRIMPLKVMADDNPDSLDIMDISNAIQYAIDNGADIVNNSFGGEGISAIEENAFAEMLNAGILAVCAAGNGASDTDSQPNYPACYEFDNILSVAACDPEDALATFSNYGQASVDVMAPGTDIWSTIPGDTYAADNGTSMATPHVTGIAGLLLSLNPRLDYRELKSIIMDSVDRIPSVSSLLASRGRVNALSALSAVNLLLTGDLTCDHQIDLEDAIVALQVLTLGSPSQLVSSFHDVGGNNKIGLEEVVYILQRISALR